MVTGPEVLDQGREPGTRRWTASIAIAAALVLLGAAAIAGVRAWTDRPPTSPELAVVEFTVLASLPVTVTSVPPVGALSTPAGTALPGLLVTARVGGDPQAAVELLPSTSDSLVHVEEAPPTTVPAGGFVDIDLTIAPVDCSAARQGTDLDEAGYRWRRPFGIELLMTADGRQVPLTDRARESFASAIATSCQAAGRAPTISVQSARRGGEAPLETIGLIVDVEAEAERLVLTPLDGPGLRGLGAADRGSGKRIPLLWLVSPRTEHNDEVPMAYTQVYAVQGSTAYPWIVGIPITDDLPSPPPLTSLRNDGVDLAEVAPRP